MARTLDDFNEELQTVAIELCNLKEVEGQIEKYIPKDLVNVRAQLQHLLQLEDANLQVRLIELEDELKHGTFEVHE